MNELDTSNAKNDSPSPSSKVMVRIGSHVRPLCLLLLLALEMGVTHSASAQAWTSLTNLPLSRSRHVAAGVQLSCGTSRVFVFGGIVFGIQHKAVDAYDPISQKWDQPGTYPDMPNSRVRPAVATDSSGKVYVIGGTGANMTDLASIDVFDPCAPSSSVWTTIPPMPTARISAGATFGPDGNLYVIGGTNTSGSQRFNVVERYNFNTTQWETLAALPTPLPGIGGSSVGAAVGCHEKIIAVSNSWPGGGTCTGHTFEYDIASNNWASKAAMPGCLGGRGVISGPNYRIYAVNDGDYFEAFPGDTRVYSYNSSADSWMIESNTAVGHNELAVAALGDQIFALGGTSKFGANPGLRFESLNTGITPICNYWEQLGGAKDIGVGADGTAWKIGTTPQGSYGYDIAYWDDIGNVWVNIPGGAVRIDVDPDGNPWVVNAYGNIYMYLKLLQRWTHIPGKATDIGIGGNGDVWKIGTNNSPPYGFDIAKWSNGSWVGINGNAVRIDVDPNGNPWVVNALGNIYKYTVSVPRWDYIPGGATDIGVGGNGAVWRTGPSQISPYGFEISKWNTNGWNPPIDGAAEEVSVGPDGKPWVVNLFDTLYRYF